MHFYRKEARFANSRAFAEPNEPSSRIRTARCGPLDILCLEDKIVQQEAVYVLEATYEADFLGFC